MAEPSTNINYRFEDIQRYLQGKMSSAEMHDIEKAALQDSFLADAIEGFNEVDSDAAQQNLNAINAKIINENKKSKVVSFKPKTKWLRIAALIILLAGFGVIGSYLIKNSNQQQQVAQVKKLQQKNKPVKDSADKKNTADELNLQNMQDEGTTVAQNERKQKPATSLKNKNDVITPDKNNQDETNVTTMMSAAPAQQREDASKSFAAAPESDKKNDSPQQILNSRLNRTSVTTNTFAGKVLDENNKPIAGAVIQSINKQNAVVTDLNGNFVLQQDDSLLNVTASTVGYEPKNTMLQTGNTNLIKLKEHTDALNDVVVTGYGVQKNKPVEKSAMPVGGWQNFNNYVVKQLNTDTTKENFITGKDLVELEFLIDNQGNPYNIKIVKSVDEEKNSKAIDIIKAGPKWTNTSRNKKGKVAIQF